MFVDECVIKVSAGDGGRGCISFRREKYEPWGGPNGGDGGAGGDVILLGSHDTNNLVDFKFKQHWKAGRGEHGLGKDCNGKEGRDAELHLPLGTIVTDVATGRVVAEVVVDGQRIVLCKGGNGGWGNTHFKTSTNRAPTRANPGQPGENGEFRMVLKSIADVGLVGFPNAGKSSLTNAITKAHPKTAAYPFTTLHPQIGVIEFKDYVRGDKRLLLADIPGLIEGASENRGLGHRFLRHVERCALLLIIVDMAGNDGRDPANDYRQLVNELKLYDPALLKKPRLLAANKMDLPCAAANLAKFKRRYKVDTVKISCLEGTGLEQLKKELLKRVTAFRRKEKVSPAVAA
jgi:GTP-binding protein